MYHRCEVRIMSNHIMACTISIYSIIPENASEVGNLQSWWIILCFIRRHVQAANPGAQKIDLSQKGQKKVERKIM